MIRTFEISECGDEESLAEMTPRLFVVPLFDTASVLQFSCNNHPKLFFTFLQFSSFLINFTFIGTTMTIQRPDDHPFTVATGENDFFYENKFL